MVLGNVMSPLWALIGNLPEKGARPWAEVCQ